MRNWSKTILSVYKYLEALSNSIDDLVVKKSIASAFYNNARFNSAYDCANKVMQLTDRKINLINLKVLVEDVLSNMPLKYKKVLALSYIDGVKNEDIANIMHISDRTFFRVKNSALDIFTKTLMGMGYSKERLEEMFCGENWLKHLYKANCKEVKRDFDDDIIKYKFFKNVIREFNMVY